MKQAHTRTSGGHRRWQFKIVSQRNLYVEVEINSSWNTHSINLRVCRFLCIMIRYHCAKFQRLTSFGWQDIQIYCLNIQKYLCKSGRSKNKKINSSWNTHAFNSRLCRLLCIIVRYLCIKFQRLTSFGWQDI